MDNVSWESIEVKLSAISTAHPWLELDRLNVLTQRILNENASYLSKRAKLVHLADDVNAALAPYTACRPGCGKCCYSPALIYAHEADTLAAASGRTRVRLPPRPPQVVVEKAIKFYGAACPFLLDGHCSVYASRPFTCRVHHSLNEDSANCDTAIPAGHRPGVAMYHPDALEVPYTFLVLKSTPLEPWGYIQEFFPGGE